jgi:hypothetical protein
MGTSLAAGSSGTNRPDIDRLIDRVRSEFMEMPGLRLTAGQARRLWALDATTADAVLHELVGSGFLQATRDGAFSRPS